jgi:hypothetical protein
MGALEMVKRITRGDSATVQAEIIALKTEHAAALREAGRLEAEQSQAPSFEGAQELKRRALVEADRAAWLAGRLRELEALHQGLRQGEQEALYAARYTRRVATHKKLVPLVRAAAAMTAEAIANDQEDRRDLGEHAAARLPVVAYLGMLLPDLVDLWEEEGRRVFAPKRRSALTPAPVVVTKPKREAVRLPGKVSRDPVPIEALTAKRVADDLAPLEAGQVRAKVLRSGYSPADDRPAATRGQVIRMPREVAALAAGSGAVQIIEDPALPAATAERAIGAGLVEAFSPPPAVGGADEEARP